jgi:hypothetical protein
MCTSTLAPRQLNLAPGGSLNFVRRRVCRRSNRSLRDSRRSFRPRPRESLATATLQ